MQLFKDSLKTLTDPLKGIVNVLIPREEPKNQLSDFIFIYPRIFWMTFPTKEKINELSETLNTQFRKNNYFIWNLSEYTYNTKVFNNQVVGLDFPGYPCPPMQYIFLICKSILEWLKNDKNNVAFVHCQAGCGRSALVIACLLTLLKVVNHPMEALTYFFKKLNLKDRAVLFPSQHLYIRNFASLLDNIQINKKAIILEKIILSEVPKFKEDERNVYISDQKLLEEETFKPYIQIFHGNKPVYNFLRINNPVEYNRTDLAIVFQVGVPVTDDLLIRCRHYRTEEDRVPVFRIMFNPYFVFDDIMRFYSRDVDFSPEFDPSNNFFIDLIFKFTDKESSEAQVLTQLKDDCLRLAKEHATKKESQAKKSSQQPDEVAQPKKQNSPKEIPPKSPEEEQKKIKEPKNKSPPQSEKKNDSSAKKDEINQAEAKTYNYDF